MQRLGLIDPAARGRRDDEPRAHGGQGRPEVRRPGGVGEGRLPIGRRSRPPSSSRTGRDKLMADVQADFDSLRTRHAAKHDRPMATLRRGPRQRDADRLDGRTTLRRRRKPGVTVFDDYDIGELRDYIDWQPFFNAWEMKGKFPDILNNPSTSRGGSQALRRRPGDARPRSSPRSGSRPAGACGFFPAASVGDDIHVYADDSRAATVATLHQLRQQGQHRDGVPNRSLADFVAPAELRGRRPRRRVRRDGRRRPAREGQASSRPPSTTTPRSWSRRWPTGSPRRSPSGSTSGSAPTCGATPPTRQLSQDDLIRERYTGIRPAPGYPACPDHTEKGALWYLLDVEAATGHRVSPSRWRCGPARSVSGWYFSHPQSQYFVVGRLGRDQVADYAERKGWTLTEAETLALPEPGLRP